MNRFRKYVSENEWTWIPMVSIGMICGTLLLFKICSIPSDIDRFNSLQSSRQELILTKKQAVAEEISHTAIMVCENLPSSGEATECVTKVSTTINNLIKEIK